MLVGVKKSENPWKTPKTNFEKMLAICDRMLRRLKGLGCFWNTFGGVKGVAGTEKDSLFVLTIMKTAENH